MSPNIENSPWVIQAIFAWLQQQPVVAVLIALMLMDTLAGTILAFVKKTLNSTTSWRGACKKGIMLLIVGGGGIMQPLLPGIPIMNMMAMYYVLTEAISLLENAAAVGVPLPAGLIDTLTKLREQRAAQFQQKGLSTTTNVNVFNQGEMPAATVPPTTAAIIINPSASQRLSQTPIPPKS